MTNNKPESIEDLAETYLQSRKMILVRPTWYQVRNAYQDGAAARDEQYKAVVSALENTSGALETLLTEFNLDLIPSVRLAFMGMVLRSRAALKNVKS
jgi:hypothetical protein